VLHVPDQAHDRRIRRGGLDTDAAAGKGRRTLGRRRRAAVQSLQVWMEGEYQDETHTHNVLDAGAGRLVGSQAFAGIPVLGEHRAAPHRCLRSAPLSGRRVRLGAGYYQYGDYGYYWVPGHWVMPPSEGLLWTPGYWGYAGRRYLWHEGYWGRKWASMAA